MDELALDQDHTKFFHGLRAQLLKSQSLSALTLGGPRGRRKFRRIQSEASSCQSWRL